MGSNPTKRATYLYGRLAQLVRAPALHAGGHRFESYTAHHLLQPLRLFIPLNHYAGLLAA